MRGTKAKRLRKEAFGGSKNEPTRQYDVINKRTRLVRNPISGKMTEIKTATLINKPGSARAVYQSMKAA